MMPDDAILPETDSDEDDSVWSPSGSDQDEDSNDDGGDKEADYGVTEGLLEEAFQNGFGLSFTTKTKRVVESSKAKAQLPDTVVFSPAVITLAVRWARARDRHFFEDSFNTVKIFASQLGYPILEFLGLRGWGLSLNKRTQKPKIEYRRVAECLDKALGHDAAVLKYNHLSCMLDRLYLMLHDNNLMMLSSKLVADDPPDANTFSNTKTTASKPSSIRRVKPDAIISFHHRKSFQCKLNSEQQHVQIGVSLIQFVIVPLLPTNEQIDERVILRWYSNVFGRFKRRKDFVEALMDMVVAFPTLKAVNALIPKITLWMKTPLGFISQVRRHVTSRRLTTEQFLDDCDVEIRQVFTKSSYEHTSRSTFKNILIMKRRVGELKREFEKAKNKRKAAPLPVTKKSKRHSPTVGAANAANAGASDQEVVRPQLSKAVSLVLANMPRLGSAVKDTARQSSTRLGTPGRKPSKEKPLAPWNARPPLVPLLQPLLPSPVLPFPDPTPDVSLNDSPRSPSPPSTDHSPSTSLSLMDPSRWVSFRHATLADLEPYRLELVVERPNLLHVLQCAPFEFYSIRDLRHDFHQFVVDDASNVPEPTTSLTITTAETCFETDEITVRRPGDHCFDNALSLLQLPIDRIMLWVHRSGVVDETRDAGATSPERVEMGVGGQAPGISDSGAYAPDKLCGLNLFTDDDEGRIMRAVLGKIYDGIQRASDETQLNLEKPLTFWHSQRFEKYAKKVQEYLYATEMRQEWLSVQVKHIASHRGGSRHTDDSNDDIEGYNKTSALCLLCFDAIGDLWSIKFMSNARGRIGGMHSSTKMSLSLKVTMECYLHSIDEVYQKYMREYTGKYCPSRPPTARDSTTFFLDDKCLWTHVPLGKSTVSSHCLRLPTTPKREYWLSAAVHWLRRMKTHLSIDQMIEMLFVAGYQNSFHHFHAIAKGMAALPFEPTDHPSEHYHSRSMELFGTFVGGPAPRYSPPGLDYGASFLSGDRARLRQVVACLRKMLGWFNEQDIHATTPLCHVREHLKACHEELLAIGNVEYGEFRLQILIQLAALTGVVLEARPLLADFAYPAKGMASYHHLHVIGGVEESSFEEAMFQMKHELQMPTAGQNEIETALCESTPGRYLEKDDVFFWGQDLHRLTKDGRVECKPWMLVVWKVLED